MKCFECDKTCEIKKYRVFPYKGVNLENIVLLNVEVEVCSYCGIETPLLKNLKRLHNSIGIALSLQKSKLSGAELRFLRRIAGLKTAEWAERIGLAEGSYNRLESGDRPITPQVDKLARINFLKELSRKDPQSYKVEYLFASLEINADKRDDLIIVIDAEDLENPAKYLPPDSLILAKPETSHVRAATASFSDILATLKVNKRKPDWTSVKNNSQFAMGA